MRVGFAAAYVGEPVSTFLKGVEDGKWPKRHKDGGNVYWFIEDLDAALDRQKSAGPDNENAADFGTDADEDEWGDCIGRGQH
jgi:hypothetical protein